MQLTLKVACLVVFLAGKCNLRALLAEQRGNLFVCNVAHLVVVVDNLAVLVTYATFASFHQCVTGFVVGTNIAINTCPALVAFA